MHTPQPARFWGIRARILMTFGLLLVMTGAGSELVRLAHGKSHAVLGRVEELHAGIQAALRLSSAVRDQYTHQAHTIILNNRTHLGHYAEAQQDVKTAMAEAKKYACSIAQCAALDAIAAVAQEMDDNFKNEILPRVPGETAMLIEPHARALALVERVVQLTDNLTANFVGAIDVAKADADRAARLVEISMAVLAAIALLIILAIASYVDRSIAVPLGTLLAATDRISKGDWTTSVKVRRLDEMGMLASHFNSMTRELTIRETKLVQAEKLAALGRVAAGVAHEINNPLTVMLGYARLIADSGHSVAKDARIILSEIDRCRDIVSGLLDFSRPAQLRLKRLTLAAVVRDVLESMSKTHPHLRTTVEAKAEGWVEADEGKVRQILMNLLKNAVEAKPDGLVTIVIQQVGTDVSIRVVDQGSGIPGPLRARLFEPFFTTKAEGTGLGLAVSRSLAQAHDGQLECLDPSGQGGACFALTLPGLMQQDAP
jgi:signal transduction histidine kinase